MNILAFSSLFSTLLFICSYLIRLGNYYSFAEFITFSFFLFFIFSNILLLYFRRAHVKVVPNIADLLVFSLVVLALLSLIYAGPTNDGFLYLGQLIIYGILPYVILRLVPRESSECRYLFWSAALLLILSVFILSFVIGFADLFVRFRLGGEIINPVGVGSIYLILSLFMLGAMYYANTGSSRFCYAILLLVSASMVFLSCSRSSIMAMLLVAVFGFMTKSKISLLKTCLVLTTATFLVNTFQFSEIDTDIFARYTKVFSGDIFVSGSGSERINLYSLSVNMIAENPISGIGLYGFQSVTGGLYPHNLFLEILLSFGIPFGSLIIMLMILSVASPYNYLKIRQNDPRLTLVFILVAILMVKMLSFNIAQLKDFLIILGLLVSFTSEKNKIKLRSV